MVRETRLQEGRWWERWVGLGEGRARHTTPNTDLSPFLFLFPTKSFTQGTRAGTVTGGGVL